MTLLKIGHYRVSFRGFAYLLRRDWYTLYRWKNPVDYDGNRVRIVDLGMFGFSEWIPSKRFKGGNEWHQN